MTDELYEATKKEAMSEHEEYKNADVPIEIWIERNKYLHQHIDMLTEELIKVRLDNKKLSKQEIEYALDTITSGQLISNNISTDDLIQALAGELGMKEIGEYNITIIREVISNKRKPISLSERLVKVKRKQSESGSKS